MSHMLPQLPENTSTRSLSPTSPAFRPSSPSLTVLPHCGVLPQLIRYWIHKHCETHSGVADTLNLHLAQFLGIGSEKKWYGTHSEKTDGKWDKTAEQMMLNFAESGHPIFLATSALERGELRSKRKGKKSIHFNGSEANIELILRTVISVNQLSTYGAVADLCKELSKDSEVAGKLAARL